MKVVTIIEDNRIVGITYGVVDIDEKAQTIKHNTQYNTLKNQFRAQQRILRTKQK